MKISIITAVVVLVVFLTPSMVCGHRPERSAQVGDQVECPKCKGMMVTSSTGSSLSQRERDLGCLINVIVCFVAGLIIVIYCTFDPTPRGHPNDYYDQ